MFVVEKLVWNGRVRTVDFKSFPRVYGRSIKHFTLREFTFSNLQTATVSHLAKRQYKSFRVIVKYRIGYSCKSFGRVRHVPPLFPFGGKPVYRQIPLVLVCGSFTTYVKDVTPRPRPTRHDGLPKTKKSTRYFFLFLFLPGNETNTTY